jgi:cytosine/adenosine deaminase-related metal-dependent hydrolase
VCLCPTTERDLADGIGPARLLRDAGAPLSLGTDSHAVVDLFEEARAVEVDERLALASVVFAATAADVHHVVVGGRVVVAGGAHRTIDVAAELARTVGGR